MGTIRLALILGLAFLATMAARPALAGGLLPPDGPIEAAVDHYVDAGLAASGTKAAPEADDGSLVRRLTLDLIGRVPTAAEVRGFVESTDP